MLGSGAGSATPFDPDNAGADGARALARVLADQGIDVEVARSAAELERVPVDASTTVVVVNPFELGESTADRLREHAADAATLVVVGAGPGVADEWGSLGGGARVSLTPGREADCDDPVFAGLALETDTATVYPGDGCFDGREGAVTARPDSGLLLFGAEEALTNDQVLRADNAAVALRLLGQSPRLVWYVPDAADRLGDDRASLGSLLPRWVVPGLVLAFFAALALALWRGRRFGPLATEPLPVVVRAVETTRSLGRLYRRSGDRQHAAQALRRASRARCAERLRIGSAASPETVVREVARRTGHPLPAVRALLDPAADVPSTDHDLIALAHDLAELEEEVRTP
nr:DUF4350 domain-containing protein [Nocardioides flavescens]